MRMVATHDDPVVAVRLPRVVRDGLGKDGELLGLTMSDLLQHAVVLLVDDLDLRESQAREEERLRQADRRVVMRTVGARIAVELPGRMMSHVVGFEQERGARSEPAPTKASRGRRGVG